MFYRVFNRIKIGKVGNNNTIGYFQTRYWLNSMYMINNSIKNTLFNLSSVFFFFASLFVIENTFFSQLQDVRQDANMFARFSKYRN